MCVLTQVCSCEIRGTVCKSILTSHADRKSGVPKTTLRFDDSHRRPLHSVTGYYGEGIQIKISQVGRPWGGPGSVQSSLPVGAAQRSCPGRAGTPTSLQPWGVWASRPAGFACGPFTPFLWPSGQVTPGWEPPAPFTRLGSPCHQPSVFQLLEQAQPWDVCCTGCFASSVPSQGQGFLELGEGGALQGSSRQGCLLKAVGCTNGPADR